MKPQRKGFIDEASGPMAGPKGVSPSARPAAPPCLHPIRGGTSPPAAPLPTFPCSPRSSLRSEGACKYCPCLSPSQNLPWPSSLPGTCPCDLCGSALPPPALSPPVEPLVPFHLSRSLGPRPACSLITPPESLYSAHLCLFQERCSPAAPLGSPGLPHCSAPLTSTSH